MKLTKSQIIKIQKNRDPYLMMDYATKVIPGKYIEGYKKLKKNEWFFKVHWPGIHGLKFSSLIIISEKFEAIKYPHLHSKKIDPICSTRP